MKINVCGSGRWGSAMAIYCTQIKHQVCLSCSKKESYHFIKDKGYSKHLPQFPFPKNIEILPPYTTPSSADLVIFAIPIPFFRDYLEKTNLSNKPILMTINKGIEQNTMHFASDIVKDFFPQNSICHLGGPCFPEGLLTSGMPAAEILGCKEEKIGKKLQVALSSPWFRLYLSQNLKEICFLGAIKNVFAIIAGIIEGKNLGEEALSILITRGIYEIRKIFLTLGFEDSSIYGLSGLGDLVLTCYSKKSSQNKNFGIEFGKGKSIQQIQKEQNGKICEGFFTAKALFQLVKKHNIDAPFIESLYKVLYQNFSIKESIYTLISRPLKNE